MKPYELTDRRPIGEIFRKMGYGFVDFLVAHRVHPDTISYCSVLFSLIAALMLAFSSRVELLLPAAPLFCFFRLYCNMVDGMAAVKSNQCSARGEVINELPDRISDTLIFTGLALSGLVSTPLTFAVIFGMLFGTYIGILGKAVGARRQFGGMMGKQQRMFVLALGCLLQFFLPTAVRSSLPYSVLDITNAIIVIGLVQTIVIRTRAIFRELNSARVDKR